MSVKTERKRNGSYHVHIYQALCICVAVFLLLALSSVLWHCWLGDRKDTLTVTAGVGLLLVMIWLELCTLPSSLASMKSRMDTFWYRLTQVHLENGQEWFISIRQCVSLSSELWHCWQEGHLACNNTASVDHGDLTGVSCVLLSLLVNR